MEYTDFDSLKNRLHGLIEAMEAELRYCENCVTSNDTRMFDEGMKKMLKKDIGRLKSVLQEE